MRCFSGVGVKVWGSDYLQAWTPEAVGWTSSGMDTQSGWQLCVGRVVSGVGRFFGLFRISNVLTTGYILIFAKNIIL